ncbi:MAG: hypothetical protein NTV07_04890 [Candidatus Omnitrophica bacterium]|nr:hypothetical protein [Candidatus Omnitrophota bacterium]
MKIMDAIGKGFSLAGRNIGLLGILFVFNAIWNIVTLPFAGEAANAAAPNITPPLAVAGLVFIFINIFIQGGVFGVLKDVLGSEGKVKLGDFTKYGQKFYLRFLGLGAIIIGFLAIAALIAGLLFSLAIAIKAVIINIVIVILAVGLVIAALFYLSLLFLSPYVLVIDDAGIFKAMASSMKFTKACYLKISGLLTLLILIGLGLGFAVGALSGIIFLALKGATFQIATGIISSAVNAYITVIISAALMSYYAALSGAGQQKKETELSAQA